MTGPSKRRPGRPPLECPTVFLPKARKGRTTRIWYMTYRGVQKSTGCVDKRAARREAAKLAKIMNDEREGILHAERISVGAVLDYYLAWVERHRPQGLRVAKNHAKQLRPFWADKIVTEIAPNADGLAYRSWWAEPPSGQPSRSAGIVRADLGHLNMALKIFSAAHKDAGLPPVYVRRPKPYPSRNVWLSRDEISRLCRAIRGRVWDPQTMDWRRLPSAVPGVPGRLDLQPLAWRASMRFLLRFVLLGVYSGSRRTVLLKLQWRSGPDHGHVDAATGDVVRLGMAEVETSKQRSSMRLPRQARVLAALWNRNDRRQLDPLSGRIAQPVTHVIHQIGKPIVDYWTEWQEVRVAAGLGPEIVSHGLRHCTATWLVEGGATIREAAAFMGVTAQTFELVYLQVSPHFARDAALALDPRRYNPRRDPNLFCDDPTPGAGVS